MNKQNVGNFLLSLVATRQVGQSFKLFQHYKYNKFIETDEDVATGQLHHKLDRVAWEIDWVPNQ